MMHFGNKSHINNINNKNVIPSHLYPVCRGWAPGRLLGVTPEDVSPQRFPAVCPPASGVLV
ncbi:MAG: hypothetical protein JWM13_1491 [Arthrobacter sp.]|nr:hypothetical protein [Arthrobacter sp.]